MNVYELLHTYISAGIIIEVATVVLNRCITDNKPKGIPEGHWSYCITYNYEYLEDYKEEDSGAFDLDSLYSFESVGSDQDTNGQKL